MADKKSNDSRRKLLKSIAAGSGAVIAGKSLPESWSKPVVDTVMLPAHAATTAADSSSTDNDCCLTGGSYCGTVDLNQDFPWVGIQIIVNANGTVDAWANWGGPQYHGTDTILCTGGSFNITATYVSQPGGELEAPSEGGSGNIALAPHTVTITGSVVCGQDTITGTYNDGRGSRNYTVTLTQGKCRW